jgi:hypothetical protein
MSEENKNDNQESLPENGADDLFKDLDSPDSEVDKTPAKVEPDIQPKTVPYDRFHRVLEENKALKGRKIEGTNPMEVVKLAKALEGYNEDEVDFITRNSKSGKIDDILAVTKDEWVKDAIDARRKKVADLKKTPGSTGSEFSSGEKSIAEIQKMTPAEAQAYEDELNRGSTGI